MISVYGSDPHGRRELQPSLGAGDFEAQEEGTTMLVRAVPEGWFSYDFAVLDATGAPVGRADLSNWRERANLDRRYVG